MAVSAVFNTQRLWSAPAWMREASCATAANPDWWFPDRGDRAIGAAGYLAIQICNQCPVRAECLEYAQQGREYGIWGGLTEQERKPPSRRRRRQDTA